MPDSTPVIAVSGLKVEREIVILDGVSWRVERGQHWAILGANGAGKTALLSTLTGYLAPTAGTVTVLGETYGRADWRALRTRVGLVSSSIRQMVPGHETALATVASGRRAMLGLWGRLKAEERRQALEILSQVEAAHLIERPWRFISQGEQQRLLIGRALMARPALLILDEPCAGLDPVAREHFLDFLERLAGAESGPTLVLVTHHVEEIVPSFSHVLMLRGGQVLAAGLKQQLLTSKRLSQLFGAAVQLHRNDGRFTLRVAPAPGVVL